ncbi:MAG: M48 family metallopeptidase [Actinomycetota bacterium]|nr:M48 family metallopeptidase [Actinomycetota bacterium]
MAVEHGALHLPGFGPEPQPEPEPVAAPRPAGSQPFRVEVVRSAKRRRTVGAQMVGDLLKVTVPSWMSRAEEEMWVHRMATSFRRKQSADRINLIQRAATLARRFQLPHPRDIRWADDMTSRWGSCTATTGHVRISTRLAAFPDWVIDYVIVHELCHLEVIGHGPDFWRLVHRYPKAERAIGYLMAKAADGDDGDGGGGDGDRL